MRINDGYTKCHGPIQVKSAESNTLTANSTTANTSNRVDGGHRRTLTVRIVEVRGLRQCKIPYLVTVFQRNEVVSEGPLVGQDDPVGSQPIAIPMKGRSITRDFRVKVRGSLANPKWETEAVL